jgi:TrkA domain protein
MEMVFSQLSVEWLRVAAGSPLAGQSLAEAAVRERTGASVIAILREGNALPNPQPDERFAAGDTLVVVGDRAQVGRFGDLLRGPGASG